LEQPKDRREWKGVIKGLLKESQGGTWTAGKKLEETGEDVPEAQKWP